MLDVDIRKKLGEIHLEAAFQRETEGVTAVFGVSGAGKTSVINMIAGLVTPDSGHISFNGKIFFDSDRKINMSVNKRFIGYVFQDSRLFPNMSIRSNLLYGSGRFSENSLKCDFDSVCSLLGIGHLLDRMPHKLSGGERQRVAIGRALLSNPEMLLMDEPLASLDSVRREELLDYISLIPKNFNIPILYVSHAIDEILRLADSLIYMNQGKLEYSGAAAETLNKIFVSNNKGRGDFFVVCEGIVKSYNKDMGAAVISFDGGTVELPMKNAQEGGKVRFKINVNEVALSVHEPKLISIRNVYKGEVRDIVKMDNNFYDVMVFTGVEMWARISAGAFSELEIKKGKQIYAMVKSAVIAGNLSSLR